MASTAKHRPTVLVLGAGGQLGREFQYLHTQENWDWIPHFLSRSELDLTDSRSLENIIAKLSPQLVINAAAYTAVDRAEQEEEKAFRINAEAPGYLAKICAKRSIFLFHFSTDYVYHNGLTRPLKEDDPCQPQSVYAKSKLAGEEAIRTVHPGNIIIRTSWVYSMYGHNFVKTMLRLGKERSEIRVVDDQVGSPTWARDLARAVLLIIQGHPTDLAERAGTYNYSNEGSCSWYAFAKAIFQHAGMPVTVRPIPTSEYPTPAKRPPYSVLDKSRFAETFHLDIPGWEGSLQACLQELI